MEAWDFGPPGMFFQGIRTWPHSATGVPVPVAPGDEVVVEVGAAVVVDVVVGLDGGPVQGEPVTKML